MKGTIFSRPLEYNIETVGEKWLQGEKVKGYFKIKNHGAEKIAIPFLKLSLSSGNYKKVKAKDKKALESLLEKTLVEDDSIEAGAEKEFAWEFSLPEDCRISDKDGSVYLAFWDKDDTWPIGNIELNIQPKMIIVHFLEVIDNFMRFKIGPLKFSKGAVEVKLTPPNSKELSHVESLVVRLNVIGEDLQLDYTFNLRMLEMMGTAMTSEKKVKHFNQTINSKKFYLYGLPNQDFIMASVNDVLGEVKSKLAL
jgi:hypothetical protein